MLRFSTLLVVVMVTLTGCFDMPAPAQYDRAMLNELFGLSRNEVESRLGKPDQVTTPEAQDDETADVSSQLIYDTPDGPLELSLDDQQGVIKIVYGDSKLESPTSSSQTEPLQ